MLDIKLTNEIKYKLKNIYDGIDWFNLIGKQYYYNL